jgi:hypothetical protein
LSREARAVRSSSVFAASAVLFLVFFAGSVAAQAQRTDAQIDGITGPVRSAVTTTGKVQFDFREPDVPSLILPTGPGVADYDRQGNRVRAGQILGGAFHGDSIRITQDGTGETEKIFENEKGQIVEHDLIGPNGVNEAEWRQDGKLTRRDVRTYDGNGHMSGLRSYDGNGKETMNSIAISDAAGNYTEQWDYGPNKTFRLHVLQTYDPDRDVTDFLSFNEDGTVKLSFRTQGTKVLAFWEAPGAGHTLGSDFWLSPVGNVQTAYSCHQDGSCDRIVTTYLDDAHENARRIERYNSSGALQVAVDYEYQLDSFGNWTRRSVFIWSQTLGERKSYETDLRTLQYWPK